MPLIEQIKKLPDLPGVYLFKKGKEILYIGKATSLKDRVRSYFSDDLINTRGQFIVDMVLNADKVDYFKTDSVLEALILEANLIKKHQPKYNTKEKDDRSYNFVVITKENFPRVMLVRGRELENSGDRIGKFKIKHKFGPYPNGSAIKEGLKIIRKIFPFRDKCVPYESPSPEKAIKAKPCFNRQIGLCPGVCSGEISKIEYGETIRNIKFFLEGKKKALMKKLEREMKGYGKNLEFEKADKIKKTLFALKHIQDVALIKKSEKEITGIYAGTLALRMEAYDVAHIGGTNMVGGIVVMENGELKKSDYRKFKIRSVKSSNDTAALKEILDRRLKHNEWQSPNIIIYDGGIAQRNAVDEVLKKNLGKNHGVKIVGVVKDEKHKPLKIVGEEETIKRHKKEILLLNGEAHRFAIGFHRRLRNNFV
ncbi:MAG: GIY-YIG nuclease family protein [Patescibacteria group bacterium]|nr:GIY-YIG nuclease family protein [Patescibacteria group bacterium]MDE1988791.1 GIY-YIG nuclease family protein [Patescibacteria group bacterium]MDE2217841.1 GIY-YIG nuclease family protein [Patescibacteria group bacterium]